MNRIKSLKSNIFMPKAIKNDGLFSCVYETGDHADWALANIRKIFDTSMNTIPRNPG